MKQVTKTYMGDRENNPWGILYMRGGNPPTAAGLFDQNGYRLAWWPAAIEPTDTNIDKVVKQLVWKRENEEPVTRAAIISLCDDGMNPDIHPKPQKAVK